LQKRVLKHADTDVRKFSRAIFAPRFSIIRSLPMKRSRALSNPTSLRLDGRLHSSRVLIRFCNAAAMSLQLRCSNRAFTLQAFHFLQRGRAENLADHLAALKPVHAPSAARMGKDGK